jgi:Zn-dependent protease
MAEILFILLVLLFSAIVHEVAHGSVAFLLGDPTAKESGRLTLNPVPHLDPIGSFVVPFFLLVFTQGHGPVFGWAKPVPVNPYNLRNGRWDTAKVAVAGAASNFAIAIFFGLAMRFLPFSAETTHFFSIIVLLNLLLAIFNLVPIPPLDGSKVLLSFLPERLWQVRVFFEQYGIALLLLFLFLGIQYLFPLILLAYFFIVGAPPA